MSTDTKTLSEQLKAHPWKLKARGQNIMARKGDGHWPEGTKHYLYSIQSDGFGVPFFFEYSQGPAHTKAPDLPALMYALLMDARSAEDYEDEWELGKALGYEVNSKETFQRLQEMYEGCKDVYNWLNKSFSCEEIVQLYTMFEDY